MDHLLSKEKALLQEGVTKRRDRRSFPEGKLKRWIRVDSV